MRFLLGAVTGFIMTIILGSMYFVWIPFDAKNKAFFFIAYWWAKAVFAATGIKVKAIGLEKLDKSKPYIYVSNHASLFDIVSVVVVIDRHIRFVAKKEISRIPVFGWAIARANIMIDRKSPTDAVRSLEKAAERISQGESVILFAEGTRTRDGNLLPFKRGAFALAVRAGVPIVPLTILGSYRIMRRGELRINKGEITILVDSPLDVRHYDAKHGTLALMKRVREIIERNYKSGNLLSVQPSS